MTRVLIAEKRSLWCWTGSVFYSANIKTIYWEYELIASVYKGFTFADLKGMAVRQRSFWYAMSRWRTSNGG